MPSPLDIEAVKGIDPDTDEEIYRKPSIAEPFAALAFKIATDPFVGRLAFMRVYSGALDAGSYVMNTRSGNKERISRLYQMHANKQNPIDRVEAGDIAAAVGFKDIRTGDTLCDLNKQIVLESMVFPEPVIAIAIEPKTQKDLDKLGMSLAKLAEEDPTFRVRYDEDTNQTVISGMGELHLEIIVDRLRREFKVECNQGAPQVNYKETLTKTVTHRERLKKQTGGSGLFADMEFELGPADESFLDSDDWWHPTKLSRCVAALQAGSDLVCHSEEWRSATSSRVVHYGPANRTNYQELLLGGNCVSTSAVVGRTKLFQELGGFSTNPRFVTAEDYELWLRLAQSRAEFVFLNEVLGVFRIHSLSASSSVDRNSRAEMAVVAHHLASAPFASPAVQRRRVARSEYGAARAFHRSRDHNRALRWFWRSIRNAPFSARTYAGTGLAVLGALRALITRRTTPHD